jgi:low affinity Fe/Cu permease
MTVATGSKQQSHQDAPTTQHHGSPGLFRRIAAGACHAAGTPWAFALAAAAIVIWLISGPFFGFSDTWQLVINTGTTIVTFLMVFLIQNTQNRDARALHLKLDELVRVIHSARDDLVDLEDQSDEELDRLQHEFQAFHDAGGGHGGRDES